METVASIALDPAPLALTDQPPWLTETVECASSAKPRRVVAASSRKPEPIGWWMVALTAATAVSVVCGGSGTKASERPAVVTIVQARS